MRKLFINLLFLAVVILCHGQGINNTWQLGNRALEFDTNPPTVSNTGVASQYGLASICDTSGNLLFYTDGINVWNKNHAIMTNGANLGDGGVIDVAIVPNPGNNNQFYIIKSEALLIFSGLPGTNYTYSVVEFNEANPNGILLPINNAPTANSVETSFSKFLLNSSGVAVRNELRYGPLAVTTNHDEDSYWLIIQNANKILSYKIDYSGINHTPIESSFANIEIYDYGTVPNSANLDYRVRGKERAKFKVSPDNSFLISLQYSIINGNGHPNLDVPFATNKFSKISFNPATGIFSNHQTLTGQGIMIEEFEISENSENLFYVRKKHPYLSGTDGEIVVKSLLNNSTAVRILNESSSGIPSSKLSYIQKDKNGEILVSSVFSTNNMNKYIHKINNQNSFSGSSVLINHIDLNNGTIYRLPKLIPEIYLPCPSNLTITSNVLSPNQDNKQAENYIIASNTINNGAIAIYHAGTSILLSDGFSALNGSRFRGYIEGCTGDFVGRISQNNELVSKEDSIIFDFEEKIIKIYPNPTNGYFNIKLSKPASGTIEISDVYGAIHKVEKLNNQESIDLNIENSKSGIYIVKIITNEGIIFTDKIIKK